MRTPRLRRAVSAALLVAGAAAAPRTAPAAHALRDLAPAERAARQDADLAAVARYRAGLARTLAQVRERADVFPAAPIPATRLLAAAERAAARDAWKSLLDYTLALDSIQGFHGEFWRLTDPADRARSLHAAAGAFLGVYRFGLDFIDRAENDPKLALVLNDAMPELGLPAGTYDRFKLRLLNVAAATRFAAYRLAAAALPGAAGAATPATEEEDAARILELGRGRGEALTAANALDVIRQVGTHAIFPVQAGVSEWMGDTKVLRQERSLVSPAQIAALRARMEPGDIMLQRREWYLSNVGLPGFWSHAALYVGTPAERRALFADPQVRAWAEGEGEPGGDLEALLRRRHPRASAAATTPQEHGREPRVLEAISEGVSFTTLEHSAAADSVVVLRPRLGPLDRARAIARAWAYAGRPYDFAFDFQTDSALVCTELIAKAYEPAPGMRGLRLPPEEILGRTAIPANAIARLFDEEAGSGAEQFELVAFLDGHEREGLAIEADRGEFRASWRRPKWHVLVQGPAGAGSPAPAAP